MSKRSFHPFPPTHWSLVKSAAAKGAPSQLAALGTFLQRYCPALKSYLVQVRRLPEHEAEDIVQSFVADKVIEQNLLQHADASRGKFRTFLLGCFGNYCVSRHRARAPLVFTGHPVNCSSHEEPPDTLLELEWARALVSEVLSVMRDECFHSKRSHVWEVFHARSVEPIYSGAAPEAYESLALRLGLASPVQAANLLVTAKRMYARLLRTAVGEYEPDESAIDDEITDLKRALGQRAVRELTAG